MSYEFVVVSVYYHEEIHLMCSLLGSEMPMHCRHSMVCQTFYTTIVDLNVLRSTNDDERFLALTLHGRRIKTCRMSKGRRRCPIHLMIRCCCCRRRRGTTRCRLWMRIEIGVRIISRGCCGCCRIEIGSSIKR